MATIHYLPKSIVEVDCNYAVPKVSVDGSDLTQASWVYPEDRNIYFQVAPDGNPILAAL